MRCACAGGDALLTICLWKAGYAHTDPGFSFYHPTVRMFDPGPEDSPGLLYAMTEALSGRCDPSCQVISRNLLPVERAFCWPGLVCPDISASAHQDHLQNCDTGLLCGSKTFQL